MAMTALGLALFSLLVPNRPIRARIEERPAAKEEGIAVVELFTSEGCNSCPPADKLLGELAADARKRGRRVYCLAFHVDYWDHLGWKDPLGSRFSSQRQAAYARLLGTRGVYTPQMIVNGADEFVGSDAARAKRSIQAALARKAAAVVTMKIEGGKEGHATVRYEVAGAPAEGSLQLAFLESERAIKVPRGENAGKELKHFNIVRGFHRVDLAKTQKGEVDLKLPAPGRGTLVAYVQDAKTGKILGATAADINPTAAAREP
jgi:hypothetical protein